MLNFCLIWIVGGNHFPASAITFVQIVCRSLLLPHINSYFDRGADQEIPSPKNAQNAISHDAYLRAPWRLPSPSFLCLLVLFQCNWLSPCPCQEAWGKGGEEDSESERRPSTKPQRVLAALTKSIYWQHIGTNIYWSLRFLQMRQSCKELCRKVAAMYPTATPIYRGPGNSTCSC